MEGMKKKKRRRRRRRRRKDKKRKEEKLKKKNQKRLNCPILFWPIVGSLFWSLLVQLLT